MTIEKLVRTNNLKCRLLVLIFIAMIAILLFASGNVASISYAVLSTSSPATNLPSIKITSPHKDQQVPVDSPVLVSGVSSPPPGDKTRMEVPPLQEMEVMLLVVMAVTAVEVVTEVMHLVVCFQHTKLSFHHH
jgi:hypothetical protein